MIGYEYSISDILKRDKNDPSRGAVIDSGNGIAKNIKEAKNIVYDKVGFSRKRKWKQHHEVIRNRGLGANWYYTYGDPVDPPQFFIQPDFDDTYYVRLKIFTILEKATN